jgi:hypothetical protein
MRSDADPFHFQARCPSRENIQHGDANRRAQSNECSIRKNSWNKTRIFAANFRRMFLRVRRLGRAQFFRTIFRSGDRAIEPPRQDHEICRAAYGPPVSIIPEQRALLFWSRGHT